MTIRDALPAAFAFAAAWPLAWLFRALAIRTGFVAQPNPLVASHRAPVPYLGGAAIAAAMLVTSGAIGTATGGALGPALVFLALGLLDDRRALSPAPKFALQALAAAWVVSLGAIAPLSGQPVLDAACSWFWILTLVNAFNFVDVCDGLLAGLAIVFFLFAALTIPGQREMALLTGGATLGVLMLNRPPARLYLGDAGSHLLGFIAAWICLAPHPDRAAFTRTAWALVVPLAELVFITAVRIAKGLPWWKGSPDHFALRLQARGWSAPQVDAAACGAAAAFAATGLAWPSLAPVWRAITTVAAIALLCLAAVALTRRPPDHRR